MNADAIALDALNEDQWLELAERHAAKDWDCAEPDGYLEAVKALCADFAAIAALEQTEEAAAPSKWGPSEIFLQLHGEDEPSESVDYTDNVTWCWHRIHDSDVRYVRADLAALPTPPKD